MTQQALIVGITGGIGSGKSTVARYLRANNCKVYDSDKAAKHIQNTNAVVRAKTVELFGEEAYNDGGMNRQFVAQRAFEDKDMLRKLSEIVHPAVKSDFLNWIKSNQNEDILFVESAILYESGFNTLVNKVLLVSARIETRICRVMRRDKTSRENVIQRIENQMNEETLKEKADIIIYTDDDIPMNVKIFVLLKKLREQIN
ncbi:MAG: dephospho-CoA kinase [Prevotellaceae bacterium]|jgi:dephospho-CoA kinase|nr:dephospho-CoA kinase [Prevotellaceae bacterium]